MVLVITTAVYCESSGCPAPELIKPCVCEDNGIICGGHSDIDLVNIFQTLEKNLTKTEKHFKSFYLNNTFITELKENTFKDITFDDVSIKYCENLSKIHTNTFAGTDSVTKVFRLSYNPKLSSSDNSIFELISKFLNLELLYLQHNDITEIPSNAFKNLMGYQDRLSMVVISGKSIKKIGSRPFSPLRRLTHLIISYTSIDYIPEYAFEFEEESNQTLSLTFDDNIFLNNSSFHQDSFKHFKIPVFITLGEPANHFEYLDEKVFKNFLNSNPQNGVEMRYQRIDCNNCKNLWLKNQDPDILQRLLRLKCSNKKALNDPDNFKNCTL